MENTKNESINLAQIEDTVGQLDELPPKDRARLKLAAWVLGALFVLTVAAGLLMIYAPDGRETSAAEFFGYVKTIVPPLVTLVIGFYFQSSND